MQFLNILAFSLSFSQLTDSSIYDFKVEALNSSEYIDFKDFTGKKILIVNVASWCAFTPQYEDLEALYQQYKDELVVVGFPSNQFLMQEPGSEKQIERFCQKNYGVTFPMTTKVKVKGRNQHPIFLSYQSPCFPWHYVTNYDITLPLSKQT